MVILDEDRRLKRLKNNFLEAVKGKLIISCQALPNEPLHSSFIMSRMAKAAAEAGASAIRCNSVVDVQAIQGIVDLPIIGLDKVDYPDAPIYITPTIKEMRGIASTGAEVVACDVTGLPRPNGETLAQIVATMRSEYPDTLLMADTASLDDVREANELGFDIIGTTMYGHTPATEGHNIADDDFAYLKEVIKLAKAPVIAEGKIDTPAKVTRVLELGCYSVVVGSIITRPQLIAVPFVEATKGLKK